ncbi:MAG: enoyl-ACP reductase [Fimbriimonadales bacterium]|nr:enoyl-ACP reductase [Fimbriimonadales bacterium]
MLTGKKGVIFGVANQHSLAWKIAQRCAAHGASLAIAYQNDRFEEKVNALASELPDAFTIQCDLNNDAEIQQVVDTLGTRWGQVDFMAHCVAYALREELVGRYLDTSREGFKIALETSVYTFVAATRALEPILSDGASVLTLTYLGSERVVPGYNVMGVAKAALEASVPYIAYELGERQIRVNAISSGPVSTLAARGIRGFTSMMEYVRHHAPFKRDTDPNEVGDTAVFLFSEMGRGVTGEVIYVDAGYHILGM